MQRKKRVIRKRTSNKRLERSGQGLLEYILISALISMTCIVAVSKFGDKLSEKFDNLNSKMKKYVSPRLR